jgi:ABC-type multidrug transport system ATPase subunit
MSSEPLLECDHLVIEREGRRVASDLSFRVSAGRVALLGDASGLFAALSGRARVSAGKFEVLGSDAREQVITGRLGLVSASLVQQPHWSGLELLTKSARLCGMSKTTAKAKGLSVLKQLRLDMFAERPLGMLGRAEQVALGIACGLLSDPRALAIETPFSRIGSSAKDWLSGLLNTAASGRHLIVSFDTALFEARTIIRRFEQVVVLGQGHAALGAPELLDASCYFVCVTRGARKLSEGLRGAGCLVTPDTSDDESPSQLIVRKDSETLPRVITEVADQLQVPLIELLALPTALSSSGSPKDRAM